jgi:hypothetical protein
MGTPRTLLLLVSLAVVLCLLVVPVLPEKETAHAKLETTTVDNTNKLLGENSPKLNPPDEAPSDPSNISSQGANVSSAMTITVPRLGLKDVAVPTGSRQAELDKQGIMHLRGSCPG